MNRTQLLITSMLVLFLIKPAIDLTWNIPIVGVGDRAFSLLHVVGVFVFVYYGRHLFMNSSTGAPYRLAFKLFIVINIVSVISTIFIEQVGPMRVIDLMLRIMDSYIFYCVSFIAAVSSSEDRSPGILKVISIGTFIALVVNFVVIKLGFGSVMLSSNNTYRAYGIYHDPGTLSNIAMYNIIFTTFMMHVLEKKNIFWYLYLCVTILMSLYLIYLGVSRAVFILMAVFLLIYISIYRQGVGKIVPIAVMGGVVMLAMLAGLSLDVYKQRFDSEFSAFQNSGQTSTRMDKDLDLGSFERLGSNRAELIAYVLDDYIKSSPKEIILGNFNKSGSHSDYIDILTRNGVVGLVIYLTFLLLVWFKTLRNITARQRDRLWTMCVLSFTLITMYMLYSIPFRPLGYTTLSWYMWVVIGYTFGKISVAGKEGRDGKPEKPDKPRLNAGVIPARKKSILLRKAL